MTDDACDFPAAHSMDTAWFAVDREGNVAVFDTGEAGAVPTEAYVGEDAYELQDALREKLPVTGLIYDVDARARFSGAQHLGSLYQPTPEWRPDLLMFLTDPDAAKPLLEGASFTEVKATQGTGLRFTNLAVPAFKALHERGLCLACTLEGGERDENLAAAGLFSYQHAAENWSAGHYALLARPEKPVKLADLPPEVAAAAIVFDGSFAQTPQLHPAELWQCEAWGPSWVASDGKTVRPFPGREADYKAEREGRDGSFVFLNTPLERPPAQRVVPKSAARSTATPAGGAAQNPSPSPKPWWKFW